MSRRPRTVAIVGGGITGLAAAFELSRAGSEDAPQVVLYEASSQLGGKLRTTTFAGLPVETGPDTMLARVPWAVQLCRDLGLGDELVSPATGRAYVWARGRLRPLPDGLVLGVPAGLSSLALSGILSPAGLARAALDPVLPPSRHGADPTVAEVIGARFGIEVVERLVEPLVAGINAGRADRLSLRGTAPDIADAADGGRSLLLALRARRRAGGDAPTTDGPVFVSLPGGLSRLVAVLENELRGAGVALRTGTRVSELPDADAVVVTTPAFEAADLLAPESPEAAGELRTIEHASVAVVTFAFPAGSITHPMDASGFLVPRREGWLMTAATFISSKWPALTPPGQVLIRCSTGRAGDERCADLDDAALAARLHAELAEAIGMRGEPLEVRVDRWMRAFPQYDSGHLARVARIEEAVARDAPRVTVAGAAYRGVGIASCIRQGREAAVRALA